jgi:hypothetical protein
MLGEAKQQSILYFAAFGELFRAILSLWLLFTLFWIPGSNKIVPPWRIRENPLMMLRVMYYFILVTLWRVSIVNITYKASNINISNPVTGKSLYRGCINKTVHSLVITAQIQYLLEYPSLRQLINGYRGVGPSAVSYQKLPVEDP